MIKRRFILQLLRHALLHVSVNQDIVQWMRLVIATFGVQSTDIVGNMKLTKKMASIVEAVQVYNH